MPDSIRLMQRVAHECACSYAEAGQIIADGGVSIDGVVVVDPQRMVGDGHVRIDPAMRPEAIQPATMLLNKPAGVTVAAAIERVMPETRWSGDPGDVRMLPRHFERLMPLMPLDADVGGLIVASQDGRIRRQLTEDARELEQEYVVEVRGDGGPYALGRLSRGIRHDGRELPPCKVSWQNEVRLRFAIHDVRPGQLRYMCGTVGFEVVAIRRIRIGRIPLRKLPVGEWCALAAGERF